MNIIEITNLSCPGTEVYSRLTEAQLRNRREPEKGIFIAESPKVIARALDAGCEPVSLLMERKHIEGDAKEIIERCGDIPVYTADRSLLAELTGYELTRGVLSAMFRPQAQSMDEICKAASRIAVIEDIVDASNLGAVFRNAAALGIDAVLLSPSCCDPLYRKAVRTSMGTVFQIPWARITCPWPGVGINILKGMGFKTAALALKEDSLPIDSKALAVEEKLAIILGTEGNGLRDETLEQSDYTVYIPMYNGVDSLNVAAAAAIAFWELRK